MQKYRLRLRAEFEADTDREFLGQVVWCIKNIGNVDARDAEKNHSVSFCLEKEIPYTNTFMMKAAKKTFR